MHERADFGVVGGEQNAAGAVGIARRQNVFMQADNTVNIQKNYFHFFNP